jgi:hypothetical protein
MASSLSPTAILTRDQLDHWRQLCQYLARQPDRAIAPPYPKRLDVSVRMLHQMARYGLVRHNDNACSYVLSPRWQTILGRLEAGKPLTFQGIGGPAPTSRHLLHWEEVCCYLESQPYGSVSYPFPTDPPITARLLKRMAVFRLVKHTDECRWKVSPKWQQILRRLWDHLPDEEDPPEPDPERGDPFVVDTNIDTWYITLLAEALPQTLLDYLADLKAQAQAEDHPIETPWQVYGAPLSMFKAGVGTSEKGRGVSWSYILRNELLMLLLRKSPLNGMIGSVRLGALCLWSEGPRNALDGLYRGVRRLWMDPAAFKEVRLQNSQIHLCADIANFAPTTELLSRIVTRSRKKAVHVPSLDEETSAYQDLLVEQLADPWELGAFPSEWEGVPIDELSDDEGEGDEAGEWEDADDEGLSVHLWGERVSGFAFSPGAPLSMVWYDKLLEERLSGKRWMQPIHEAGGWRPGMVLTRIEPRLTREIFRELKEVLPNARASWVDDPYLLLDHLQDVWGLVVGLPERADFAPDVFSRGWMRLVMPAGEDTNKWRWPLDPVWQVVQSAQFNDRLPKALTREKRVVHDLEQVDAELYGLLKLRAVIRGEYLSHTTTLSQELHAFHDRMEEVDAKKGRDFAEEVREKARGLGKPVPKRKLSILLTS